MESEAARVEYPSDGQARIVGEIDLANADVIGAALAPAVAESNGRLTLDLSGVTFMDSTGIKMLLALHIIAVLVLLTMPGASDEKRRRWATGIAWSGAAVVAISAVLRWLSLSPVVKLP